MATASRVAPGFIELFHLHMPRKPNKVAMSKAMWHPGHVLVTNTSVSLKGDCQTCVVIRKLRRNSSGISLSFFKVGERF